MQYVNIFRAKIVDVCEEALIIEITGDIEKIDAFLSLLKGYGIKRFHVLVLLQCPVDFVHDDP